jgi:coenzyme F420 hydrogenase subunit beta
MSPHDILVDRVLRPELCVVSGVYSAVDPSLSVRMNARGHYEYVGLDVGYDGPVEKILAVSAFGGVGPHEDQIAESLFGSEPGARYDPVGGYYQAAFAGWAGDDLRDQASSGGITTWVLLALLESGQIDGVIHMAPGRPGGPLFEYRVSRTADEVRERSKSRYYPGELSSVLSEVRRTPGRYALVAIPSIVFEVRLLQELDPLYRDRITTVIGLICGHQKSAHYAEYLGWRAGFEPGTLQTVNFRKKLPHVPANSYSTEFVGTQAGGNTTLIVEGDKLYGTDWGHGFFKAPFSDFTEDILNETADLVVGDAWLPRYVSDSRGTNVLVARSPRALRMLRAGAERGDIHLEPLEMSEVLESQSSLVSHNVRELPYRVRHITSGDRDTALIRRPTGGRVPWGRRRVQAIRHAISRASHDAYARAKEAGSLAVFDETMHPLTRRYATAQRIVSWQRRLGGGPRAVLRRVFSRLRRGTRG